MEKIIANLEKLERKAYNLLVYFCGERKGAVSNSSRLTYEEKTLKLINEINSHLNVIFSEIRKSCK